MSDITSSATAHYDVVVAGGGPAGLAAATELKRLGVSNVAVFEREPEAGGIPRHCGHPPFGMREFRRILSGPKYAKKLVETTLAAGVEINTSATVVEARPSGELLVTTEHGAREIKARRIVYATGVRETPRSARLISGSRPLGIINTGALQSMIYLKNRIPFERPLIVGTELVSFSAIMTCRYAKIRPIAMIEETSRVIARWPLALYPPMVGVPLHLNTRLVSIEGNERVNAAVVENVNGNRREIGCDGVILTGRFTPEASLARSGHLAVDPASGGPVIDQYGRCSDPAYFAAGNVLRPVETAGWSWNEGRQTGRWVADDLAGNLPSQNRELRIVTTGHLIRFAVPQRIVLPRAATSMQHLQVRFSQTARGDLVVLNGQMVVWKKRISVHPERRFLVPIDELVSGLDAGRLELRFDELEP